MHIGRSVLFFGFASLMPSVSEFNNHFTLEAERLLNRKKETISCAPSIYNQPTDLEEVTINNNQKPAGVFRNGIYYLTLEAREGYWYPESKAGAPVRIKAFAEAGKPLQVQTGIIEGIYLFSKQSAFTGP